MIISAPRAYATKPVVFGSASRDGRGLFQRALRRLFDRCNQGSTPTVCARPTRNEHAVLPEVISKEPLGAVVREGDAHWANLVRWVHFAMLNAEEHGVNSENVGDRRANDPVPAIRRLLGMEGAFGAMLDLDEAWAFNVIRHVGNYGEVFARQYPVMPPPLNIQRGLNALWTRRRPAIRPSGSLTPVDTL